jgi:mannose-1-phosphate guanylyltransferase
MVLAAGFGTRLRPLTDELPKPLLPLGDRSLLEHALAAYGASGLGFPVLVNVHHLAAQFVGLLPELGGRVELIIEPEIRGTAGGIAGARARLGPGPVVVTIADVVLECVPPDFAERAEPDELVLAVAPRPPGVGTVGVGRDGSVVRLRGERFGEEQSGGEYVGLAALGADALARLPERGCLVQDFALPELRRGRSVRTAPFEYGALFPGDDLAGYLAANLGWLERRGFERYVAPSAEIGQGVELERSLVGRGAHVFGNGRIVDSVILPGAEARAPLERVVVTPSGFVVPIPRP